MGGAQVAAVDDDSAAWSNPAALAGLKGLELRGPRRWRRAEPQQPGRHAGRPGRPSLRRDRRRRPAGARSRSSSAASRTWRARARASSARASRASSPRTRVSRSRSATCPTPGIYPEIDLQHIVPGGGPDNGLEFNDDRPLPGGPVGAGGAAGVRPRLPERRPRGRRRGPLRFGRDVLRPLRRVRRRACDGPATSAI